MEIDLFWLTAAFTAVTALAHLAYATNGFGTGWGSKPAKPPQSSRPTSTTANDRQQTTGIYTRLGALRPRIRLRLRPALIGNALRPKFPVCVSTMAWGDVQRNLTRAPSRTARRRSPTRPAPPGRRGGAPAPRPDLGTPTRRGTRYETGSCATWPRPPSPSSFASRRS
jgi:hypothetical protein